MPQVMEAVEQGDVVGIEPDVAEQGAVVDGQHAKETPRAVFKRPSPEINTAASSSRKKQRQT
jgi:hypothetical protein